ncbi:MAG: hypothetical protein AAGI11_15320 [Pseudomonadota bacterium]
MAINPEDVKLFEPQRLTDEDDGGGRATGNEIVDRVVNNMFPDISRLNRALGVVNLRKAFVGVSTDNQDVYLGAHAIIAKPPADPNVSVLMFDAGSENDERAAAQNRIESYVVQGSAAQFDLQGTQYEGQRAIVCFQREEQTEPEVGEVKLLRDEAAGVEQYVRITEVESQLLPYTVQSGSNFVEFTRRRLDLGLSAPLDFTFPGGEVRPDGPSSPHTDVFDTEVADAAEYWGAARSVADIVPGDTQIKVDSIFASLVPSSQAESPLIDIPLGYNNTELRQAASSDYSEPASLIYIDASNAVGYLSRPAQRGTVSLQIGSSVYGDDGSGTLTRLGGTQPFSTLSIDYSTGLISGARDSGQTSAGFTETGSVTYRPAGAFSGRAVSLAVPVELANRGFNWIQSFAEGKPRPGTLVVSYMSQQRWYDIKDAGNGQLAGVGAGTIDYATGTASVTLTALPDVGSAVIWSFIADIAEELDEQDGVNASAGGEIDVAIDPGAAPGSVVVTYLVGGSPQTLDDSSTVAELAGDGVGSVDYAQGALRFTPSAVPDDGSSITVDYNFAGNSSYRIDSPAFSNGVLNGTIPSAPHKPGSISMTTLASYVEPGLFNNAARMRLLTIQDDGAGGFKNFVGTINYTTGVFSVEVLREYNNYRREYVWSRTYNSGYTVTTSKNSTLQTLREQSGGAVDIVYQPASTSDSAGQSVLAFTQVELDLLPGEINPLVPGSLLFEWGGKTYFDRDGIIYTDFSPTTGAGPAVGTIDYSEKKAVLTSWPEGASPGVIIRAGLTVNGRSSVNRISFRTPGSPLRPGSLGITVTDQDGNLINEQAGIDGVIDGALVQGTVNTENGLVDLEFTDGVDPVYVFASSGRYSGVLLSILPLDAEIIGMDPVRLPSDGRVPIYRKGNLMVITHVADTDVGTPVAGQQVALTRDEQALIWIEDAVGNELDPAQYVANRATGVVTFATPLSLETLDQVALVPPLVIKDRIEHWSAVSDVQITGEISFSSPTGYAFPVGSVVSSAKVWGDINSRYLNFFKQRTWSGSAPNWTSDRIGDDTSAAYNEIDNPVEVANRGAITEKWAVVFTSSINFDLVGETLGIIASGATSVDLAPINQNTGFPYFILRAAGWGGGWSAGNVVRFDTEGCLAPVWLARTVLSGQASMDDDEFQLLVRGDAD